MILNWDRIRLTFGFYGTSLAMYLTKSFIDSSQYSPFIYASIFLPSFLIVLILPSPCTAKSTLVFKSFSWSSWSWSIASYKSYYSPNYLLSWTSYSSSNIISRVYFLIIEYQFITTNISNIINHSILISSHIFLLRSLLFFPQNR